MAPRTIFKGPLVSKLPVKSTMIAKNQKLYNVHCYHVLGLFFGRHMDNMALVKIKYIMKEERQKTKKTYHRQK